MAERAEEADVPPAHPSVYKSPETSVPVIFTAHVHFQYEGYIYT